MGQCGSARKLTKEKKLQTDNKNQYLIQQLGSQFYEHIYKEMEVLVRANILELLNLQNVEVQDIIKAKNTIKDEYDQISQKFKEMQMIQLNEESFKQVEFEQNQNDLKSQNEIKIFNLLFNQDYLEDLINRVNKAYDSFFRYIEERKVQDDIFNFCEEQFSQEKIEVRKIDNHAAFQQRLFRESKSKLEGKMNDYLKNNPDCVNMNQLLWMKFSNNQKEDIHPLSQLVKKSKYLIDQEGFVSQLKFELADRENKKNQESKNVNVIPEQSSDDTNTQPNGEQSKKQSKNQNVKQITKQVKDKDDNKQQQQTIKFESISTITSNINHKQHYNLKSPKQNYIQTEDPSVSQLVVALETKFGTGKNKTFSTLTAGNKVGMSSTNPGQSNLDNNNNQSGSQILSDMKIKLPSFFPNDPKSMNSKITVEEEDDYDKNCERNKNDLSNDTGNQCNKQQSGQINNEIIQQHNTSAAQNGLSTIHRSQITLGNGAQSEIKYVINSTKTISSLNQVAKTQKEIQYEAMKNVFVNIGNKDVPISQLKNDQKVNELMKSPEFEQQFDKFFKEAIDKDPNNKDLQKLQANQHSQFQESPSKILDFLGSAIH